MRELLLSSDEFTGFSVPHTLCLAGECQYSLGLASVVIATSLRVQARVEETAEEFQLDVAPDALVTDHVRHLMTRWRTVLEELVAGYPEQLTGLRISLGLQETAGCGQPEAALYSPAVAVALACAVKAHRGVLGTVRGREMAELGAGLLRELVRPAHPHPDRFYAECLVCVEGGARHVSSSSESLNLQLMIPPESLILAVSREAAAYRQGGSWEKVLLGALGKMGSRGAELLAAAERDASPLFELASSMLDERETAVLYGLLRVREMIAQQLESLGRPLADHDLLAELCDEESAILENYFWFPGAPYCELRKRAVESGALGAKLTYAFGTQPAMIILAPGCRDEVKSVLDEEFEGCNVLPVDVDAAGAGMAQAEGADESAGLE